METDLKGSLQYDSDKASTEFESQIDMMEVRKVSKLRFALVFSGLLLGFFMSALDQTIVITALGQISGEFKATNDIGWVGSAYLLTMSGFQPMYGIFADIIGHKTVYLIAIVIFLIGSAMCGLSSSMFMLIMSRGVQGIGGAGLITVVLIIVSDVVSKRERATYQGILGCALGIATVAGPLIGGAFADADLWRWSFYMNLFIGIPVIVVIVFFFNRDLYIHEREPSTLPLIQQLRRADYGSLLLMMPGAICILVALQTGGELLSWSSPLVIALFCVGSVCLVLFVLSEIFVVKHNPVMPRRIITQVTSVAIFAAQFFASASDYALLYFIPLHFQIVRGDSAVQSAMELLALFIPAVIAGLISGILITKTGHYRIYLWLGCGLPVICNALMATSTIDTPILHQHIFLAIGGVGVGLLKQGLVVAGQACVEEKDLSLATSHGQFFRILGGAVGISVSATFFRYNMTRGMKEITDKYKLHITLKNINEIKHIPRTIRVQIQAVTVQSLDKIYIFAAVVAALALIAILFIKHYDVWTPEEEEEEQQDEKRQGDKSLYH